MASRLLSKVRLRNLFIIVFLSVITFLTLQPTNVANANPASINIDGFVFEVGKTYPARFSTYFPSGPSSEDSTDAKGKPIEISRPTCKSIVGLPYGTKLRIFTDNDKNGTMCVVNSYVQNSFDSNYVAISLLAGSVQEILNWSATNGRFILLSLGDDKNLDYIDDGSYKTPGETIEVSPDLGIGDRLNEKENREEFFVKNDILFYNPEENLCAPNSDETLGNTATLDQRVEYVLRFLTGAGFTLNQAAGIVGNLIGESGVMPACLEKARGSATPGSCESKASRCAENTFDPTNGTYRCEPATMPFNSGIGIAQWTGGRQSVLQEIATKRNKHVFDMDVQLETLLHDMAYARKGVFANTPNRLANEKPNVSIGKAKTVEEATFTFLDVFEAPAKAIDCGYANKGRMGKKSCEGEIVTEEIAHNTYLSYKQRRVGPGEKYANQFRDTISDGTGVTVESIKQLLESDSFGGSGDPSLDVDLCQDGDASAVGELINLVEKTAWPIYCAPGTTKDTGNGITCSANQPKDFYRALTSCRRMGGKAEDNGTCKYKNSWIGHYTGNNFGQDCGGFVATVVQESGFDPDYAAGPFRGGTTAQEKYLMQSPKWEKVFKHGTQFDQSQLMPGDVAICNKDIDGCNSSGHVFLYTGQITNFEYPAASASLLKRYPMAGHEMANYQSYNWYRNKEQQAQSVVAVDPRTRTGSGKVDLTQYKTITGSMSSLSDAIRSQGIYQDVNKAKYGNSCLSFAYYHGKRAYDNAYYGMSITQADNYSEETRFSGPMYGDMSTTLQTIYNSVSNGKPVILRVNNDLNYSRQGGRHFVTVVGYKNYIMSSNQLREEDLLIIDSWDGNLETMDSPKSRFMTLENGQFRVQVLK